MLGASTLFLASALAVPSLPPSLVHLHQALLDHGFRVVFRHPTPANAYGRFESKTKTLMISPLAFELGIGAQVFVHEAVHAAQSCPSGSLSPLGWTFPVSPVVEREISGVLYNAYRHRNKALEREAFMAQSQSVAPRLLIEAIEARCR